MYNPEGILEIKNLSVHFRKSGFWFTGGRTIKAVDRVSLQLQRGEIFGLVGESGCGKTTLGKAIVQLIPPTDGEIRYAGKNIASYRGGDLKRLRKQIQIVFQDPFSSLNPKMQIRQLIAEPLLYHGLISNREVDNRVQELLSVVGLEPYFMYRYPHEMSGGQRQRIAIARVMGLEPELIVADEPVSALDTSVKAQILKIFSELRIQRNITILMISHDLSVIQKIADRVAVMKEGRILESGPKSRIIEHPEHAYTRELLDSRPVIPFR